MPNAEEQQEFTWASGSLEVGFKSAVFLPVKCGQAGRLNRGCWAASWAGAPPLCIQAPDERCERVKLWPRPHMHVQSPQFALRRLNFVPAQRQDAHAVSEADLRNLIPLNDPVEVRALFGEHPGRPAGACTLRAGWGEAPWG